MTDQKTDSFGGSPNIRVDTYIENALGLRGPGHYRNHGYEAHQTEIDQHAGPPVYAARKIRADRKAIANFDNLPRPKKPPGK